MSSPTSTFSNVKQLQILFNLDYVEFKRGLKEFKYLSTEEKYYKISILCLNIE